MAKRLPTASPESAAAPKKKPASAADHLAPYRIPKGQSGNPAGRPVGNRNKLSESFLASLQRSWKEHGDEILTRTLEQNPAALVSAIARILPKDFELKVSGGVSISHELTPEQRQRIAQAWLVSQQARPAIDGEAVHETPAQGG